MDIQGPNYTTIKEIILGVSALVGLILAIYKLIRSVNKEKIIIKIIPKTVLGDSFKNSTSKKGLILSNRDFYIRHWLFAFEIINKSSFPVTINEIGFVARGKKKWFSIPNPMLQKERSWPIELKPRSSEIVCAKLNSVLSVAKNYKIRFAYVKTACDHIFYGKSRALEKLIIYVKDNKF